MIVLLKTKQCILHEWFQAPAFDLSRFIFQFDLLLRRMQNVLCPSPSPQAAQPGI